MYARDSQRWSACWSLLVPVGPWRLPGDQCRKLAPHGVVEALGAGAVLGQVGNTHPFHSDDIYSDDIKGVEDAAAVLVSNVLLLPPRPFPRPCAPLSPMVSCRSSHACLRVGEQRVSQPAHLLRLLGQKPLLALGGIAAVVERREQRRGQNPRSPFRSAYALQTRFVHRLQGGRDVFGRRRFIPRAQAKGRPCILP
jgi:hypothetical protein